MSSNSSKDSLLSDDESEEKIVKTQTIADEDLDGTAIDYTEEELNELVNFIKDMTTIYDLQPTDWREYHDDIIKHFILDINVLLLFIFFDESTLTCSFEIPKTPFIDITYFLRKPSQVFQVETFHDSVTFGTIDYSIDGSLLNLIDNLYSPIFANSDQWPESVRSHFCHELYMFLQKFSDIHYKLLGLTVLYIPKEIIDLPLEAIINDRELIRRIEATVMYWIGQIVFALNEQEQTASKDLPRLTDEHEFWIHRYENLSGLSHQLSNKTVKHICNILSVLQSTYYNQFVDLFDQLETKLDETKSNIEYLSILCKSSDELFEMEDISKLHDKIEEILHLIRFIWLNSPFYSSTQRITTLCRFLSNQLIVQCTRTVNLSLILEEKRTQYGIETFEKCINCLRDYIRTYTLVAASHSRFGTIPWVLDREPIFNHIDSFIQRCNDMIDVCKAMVHFGRYHENEDIAKPLFGGSRYLDFDIWCNKIEQIFNDSLQEIIDMDYIILDVNTSEWYDQILKFKSNMKDIESIIENLANSVFEECAHTGEGIECLAQFYNYSRRQSLRPSIENKTAQVYKMFQKEVMENKHDLIEDLCPGQLPCYSGRATIIKAKQYRLKNIREKFTTARWMLPCSISKEVFLLYDRVMLSIEEHLSKLYREWISTFDTSIANHVQQPLMRKSIKRPGLIECNLDYSLIEAFREANYWESLGYEIPMHLKDVYKRYTPIKLAYNSVINVVLDYNKIIRSLSDEERLLFKPLIVNVERKLAPALRTLTWSSNVSDEYITECVTFIADLQKFLNDYKISNMKIVKICEDICNMTMFTLETNSVYALYDFEDRISEKLNTTVAKLTDCYKQIIQYLILVFEAFENHMNSIADQWVKYINNFDKLLEESVKICCRKSLAKLYDILHGDETVTPNPLIQIHCFLRNQRIEFIPTLNEIAKIFYEMLYYIICGLRSLPRISDKFHAAKNEMPTHCKIIADDEECKRLQRLIEEEINLNNSLIHEFMNIWKPFRDVWKIDKDVFLANYELENPSPMQFDLDISRYNDIANNIELQETVVVVYFIQINFGELKKSIIEQCNEWQHRLCELLLSLTIKNIDEVHDHIKTNTEKLIKKPEDMKEMEVAIKFYDKCSTEAEKMKDIFPLMVDQIRVLDKYKVDLAMEYRQLQQSLPAMWEQYLELLEYTEKMLGYAKVIISASDEREEK